MLAWELIVVVLLILLNGFFAMSELAVVSARRARLQQMADEGHRGARAAVRLVEDPSKFLSTVQVGITLIGILAGAYGGATFAGYLAVELRRFPAIEPYADGISIAVVVVSITYLSLIIGELVPKRIALVNAERIAAMVARPMGIIATMGAPLVWLLGVSTNLVLRLLRLDKVKQAEVTEEEVKSMIAEGARTGVFDPAEREMLEGVLRLADRSVRTIMTPRPDVVWLDIDDKPEDICREITASGRSRFPVSRGDLDEIVGIVHSKDLLDLLLTGKPLDLQVCLHKPLIIHDGTPVLRVLELFKQAGLHMAIVVDEYGSIEGIATVTDILETIAGDFPMRERTTPAPSGARTVPGWWTACCRSTRSSTGLACAACSPIGISTRWRGSSWRNWAMCRAPASISSGRAAGSKSWTWTAAGWTRSW
jgi:putative hemolysin